MRTTTMKLTLMTTYLYHAGLITGALALEVDKLDTVPEFQRGWYAQDPTTQKFKLDPDKVEVEDVTGLKNTTAALRREIAEAKAAHERALREELKKYEGIDPEETRKLLSQFASEEEKRLIQMGHIDQVIAKRMEKQREELERQTSDATKERDGALEVATTFMERVLDNHVREACAKAGVHTGAVEDALLRARGIFSLNDDGEAVQFEEDGETVVLAKDGKTPYSPAEWIEEMREKAPHWFPADGTGGGATGSRTKGGKVDLSHLSPTERLTAARQQGQQGRK